MTTDSTSTKQSKNEEIMTKFSAERSKIEDHPEQELFLWALLLNRKNLADYFWKAGNDHIGGALVASMIMKSLAEKAKAEVELSLFQELMQNSMSVHLHLLLSQSSECLKVSFYYFSSNSKCMRLVKSINTRTG